MKRLPQALLALIALCLLAACEQTIRVDPAAMPWEVAILNGACQSALQNRSDQLHSRPRSGFKVVRTLDCPAPLNDTRDVVSLLQLRSNDGDLFWFEEELVRR